VRALAQAAQLAQIFPSAPPSAIAEALASTGGDVQQAAGLLLQAQESPAHRALPVSYALAAALRCSATGGGTPPACWVL